MKQGDRSNIAIIGMACRFPGGASSHEAYWKLLLDGKDAIVDIPKKRWDIRRFYDANPDKEGKAYVKQGGFLHEDLELFDPMFFGISPREAESLDPMQRLLLEVTWEAFEDAGVIPDQLKGSKTGVFIGGFCLDNFIGRTSPLNLNIMGPNTPASSTMTVLANRISHVFDFWGPSITMDTACSSSLVATHVACQSLWNNESDIALVGGANAMLRPELSMMMCKGKFLAEHGRCMAFDEKAGGYTRGEGAGVVLLKRMADAIRDKDQIYASIRITGVNQDGHTPGISLPNPDSQEKLIRDVYERGGIDSAEIDYVEAHGTGTQAGDTAELHALDAVLAEKRQGANKCYVGSVKTNIGHLEAAAGVAGLIKAALVLKHKQIPPNLHFVTPNPKIPFDDYCLEIPVKPIDLPQHDRLNLVSVNSFGYGGTNAHVVLESAPVSKQTRTSTSQTPTRHQMITLSAKSKQALKGLAGKYSFFITTNGEKVRLEDIAYTTCLKRSHLEYRMSVLAESNDDLREKLTMFNMGEIYEGVAQGQIVTEENPGLVFVFTGMGPQWWGMGRELMEKETVFKDSLKKSDAVFKKISGWSILDELLRDEADSKINETQIAQPANFVLQVALYELWKSRGIKPAAIIGHSVGEVAAAYAAGVLSLEDALLVSYHRSRLQQSLDGKNGTMLAISLPEKEALALISDFTETVAIAAINSPSSVTLAGDKDDLQKIADQLEKKEVFNRFLKVELAYHSPQMDVIKEELLQVLAKISPVDTELPLFAAVTGQEKAGSEWTGEYWWDNVRQPVRFFDAIKNLLDAGYQHFLEIGPHPVLGNSIKESGLKLDKPVKAIPTLNRKQPEMATFQGSLGELYCNGYDPDWESIVAPDSQFIRLPGYPWQRERYWSETQISREYRLGLPGHVFFNNNSRAPMPVWTVELNSQFFPFLNDHKVESSIVFPGAGYVAAGLELHKKYFDNDFCILENIEFHSPLVIDVNKVQMLASCYESETNKFSIYSKIEEDDSEWQQHASGAIVDDALEAVDEEVDLADLKSRLDQNYPVDRFCEMLENRGLHYGRAFKCITDFKKNGDEFLIKIESYNALERDVDDYLLHPTILDAAFQATLGMIETDHLFIPVNIKRIRFYQSPEQKSMCFGKITKLLANSFDADISITDEQGRLCVVLEGLHCRAITMHQEKSVKEFCYDFSWDEVALDDDISEAATKCLVLGADSAWKKAATRFSAVQGTEVIFLQKQDIQKYLKDHKGSSISHILYLADGKQKDFDELFSESVFQTNQVVELIKEWENQCPGKELSLCLVTRGAQVVEEGDQLSHLAAAPLWGLGLLIENEHANIKCKLIDVPESEIPEAVFSEFLAANSDNDVAIRSGKRFIRKLIRTPFESDKDDKPKTKLSSTELPVAMAFTTPGNPESAIFQEIERKEPGPDEIEIKVDSVALSIADAWKASGKLSGNDSEDILGMEAAGTVITVGKGIDRFKAGDEVIAFSLTGAFASYLTVPATCVTSKPEELTLEESTVYSAFSSAYYALVNIANLQPGEKVLIHNASEEIGLCAIQIAQRTGAKILATAGTPEKREYLKELGIEQVMDSLSLKFVEEIRNNTGAIDVVLNLLAGDSVSQSLSLLAPYGRFIELGKPVLAGNHNLSLAPFKRNLTFASLDFDCMIRERPKLVQQLINDINVGFEKGDFHSLPLMSFSAGKISDALTLISQEQHLGKVIIKFAEEEVPVLYKEKQEEIIHREATYLITGGTRGFGLEVARYLAGAGAGNLVLVSRSGAVTEEAQLAVSSLKAQGCQVLTKAVDITDEAAVKVLLADIASELPPLKGIFHGAMVLDDAMLTELDSERIEKVLNPKIAGAIYLHEYTKDRDLDFFVSFSSISSITGNKGQGNYVAANAFLDAFSYYRRSMGMPASTINWGALGEAGVVARSEGLESLLKAEGINGLSNEQAFHGLELVLKQQPVQIGIFDVNWETWSQLNQDAASSSRFQDLVENLDETPGAHKRRELTELLLGMEKSNRQEHLESILCDSVSKVLRFSSGSIDPHKALSSLGIDSLTAVELLLVLKTEGGIELSTIDLLKGGTISQLAGQILENLLPEGKK